MRFLFITLFPEQIEQAAGHSIIKRAVDAGLVEVSCINPRDFATDRHRTVDDTPFGGGARHGFEARADGSGYPHGQTAAACSEGYCHVPGRAHIKAGYR